MSKTSVAVERRNGNVYVTAPEPYAGTWVKETDEWRQRLATKLLTKFGLAVDDFVFADEPGYSAPSP